MSEAFDVIRSLREPLNCLGSPPTPWPTASWPVAPGSYLIGLRRVCC